LDGVSSDGIIDVGAMVQNPSMDSGVEMQPLDMTTEGEDHQVDQAPLALEPGNDRVAPSSLRSRRRSSLNTVIAKAVEKEKRAEREGVRGTAAEVQHQNTFSPATGTFERKELVLSGTLSSEVGDQLVAVALGEEVQAGPTRDEKVWLGALALLPGLVAGVIDGLIPLNSPQHGLDINFLAFLGATSFVAGVGVSYFTHPLFFSRATLASGAKDGFVTTLAYFVAYLILGTFWRFPIPMAYPIASSVGGPSILFAVIHGIFGIPAAFSANVRQKLIAPILMASMVLVFLFVFALYRTVFDRLSPSQQFYFAPLWPMIKIAFKKAGAKIVDRAKNPDIAPFVLFLFDVLAGLSGNFLFLSAAEPESVLSMIFVDVIENMSLAIRVIFRINTYQKAEEKRERAQAVAKMEAMASTIERLKIVVFENREAAHIAGATDKISNGTAVDGAGEETLPLLDEAVPDNNAVLLHKAVRLILSFVASETGEILSSFWSMVMLPFLYYGHNKLWFYVIRDMDDAAFWKAFQFSMLDAGLELLSFVILGVFISLTTGLKLLPVGLAYVRNRELHVTILMGSISLPLLAFSFFVVHYGVDPTFQFDYDSESAPLAFANATRP
jgi:hypothetical protein